MSHIRWNRPGDRLRHTWEDNVKMVLKETVRRCEPNLSDLEQGPILGSHEYSYKPLSSTKGREHSDKMDDQLSKNNFAAWS